MKDYLQNFLDSDDLEILRPFRKKNKISDSNSNYDVTYIYPKNSISAPINYVPKERLYNPIPRDYICRNPIPVIPLVPIGLNYY